MTSARGYACLAQLRRPPLTEVKIDRTYLSTVVRSARADRAIVTSVHRLAQTLGVDVVAEGIEDRSTVRALRAFTGMIGQGRYFGKPRNAADLQRWRERRDRGR